MSNKAESSDVGNALEEFILADPPPTIAPPP